MQCSNILWPMLKDRIGTQIKQAYQRKLINTIVHNFRQSDFHKRKVFDQTMYFLHTSATQSPLASTCRDAYTASSCLHPQTNIARPEHSSSQARHPERAWRSRPDGEATLWQFRLIIQLLLADDWDSRSFHTSLLFQESCKNMFQETFNTCKPPLLPSKGNIY